MYLCLFVVSIFDLEDDIDPNPSKDETTLPFLELTQAPRQSHQRSRSSGGSGSALPQSLSSLRPISLPSPSGSRLMSPPEHPVTSLKEESATDSLISSPESKLVNNPGEDDAILKLVAADTPSHRGFWDKSNGKALRMIMDEGDTRHISASKSPIDSETASINDEIGRFTYEISLVDSH